DALGIEIGRRDQNAAAARAQARTRSRAWQDGNFARARRKDAGRPYGDGLLHGDAHPFETFVEVDAVAGGVEALGVRFDVARRVVVDDGGRRVALTRARPD